MISIIDYSDFCLDYILGKKWQGKTFAEAFQKNFLKNFPLTWDAKKIFQEFVKKGLTK